MRAVIFMHDVVCSNLGCLIGCLLDVYSDTCCSGERRITGTIAERP